VLSRPQNQTKFDPVKRSPEADYLIFSLKIISRRYKPKFRYGIGNPFGDISLRVPLKAGKGACLHAEVPDQSI
jgi:hypothetical protein